MPIRIPIPEEKTFYFRLEEFEGDNRGKLVRVSHGEGHDCYVSFRQGTQGDNRSRAEITGRSEWRLSEDGADVVQVNVDNFPALVERDVMLTLTGTDIEFGDIILSFAGTPRRVQNEQDFRAWWSALPPMWAAAIYEACLELNPLWRSKR